MSDLFVVLPPATAKGRVLFAKNCDRPPSEVQEVVYCPPADHPPGAKVKTTFLEVSQASHTHGVVLSKAGWAWGAEMGANDQGLTGGCAAVWTKLCHPGDHRERLLAVDLVRLALERSSTAREAVDVVTSLLATHGQGGPCCEDPSYGQWTYHAAFLFADRRHAWALETADQLWVAKHVTEGVYAMSSMLSIGSDYDLSSDGLVEAAAESGGQGKGDGGRVHFARAFGDTFQGLSLSDRQQPANRLAKASQLLQDKANDHGLSALDAMSVLRDEDIGVNLSGELVSAASLVSVLQPPDSHAPDVHWLTATPAPHLSVFKPFVFCPAPDVGGATACPTLSPVTEPRSRSGSQPCADRRHFLYRMHEQGREAMEAGGAQGKKLLETLQALERQCVQDVEDFVDNFKTSLLPEVSGLFRDAAETEAKFYK